MNTGIVEFFAGSRSIGKAADALGVPCWSTDVKAFDGIDHVSDILEFSPADTVLPFVPRVGWFSPVCTSYSVAACSHHRNLDLSPKTEEAVLGDKMLAKVLEIIRYYETVYPGFVWFIENPRGLMRKMPCMLDLPRHTVTYCQYGDTRMKPTDIWTNSKTWVPRPICKNGDPCHESAPRGSKTGTQGRKGSYERSKIPEQLCLDIIETYFL